MRNARRINEKDKGTEKSQKKNLKKETWKWEQKRREYLKLIYKEKTALVRQRDSQWERKQEKGEFTVQRERVESLFDMQECKENIKGRWRTFDCFERSTIILLHFNISSLFHQISNNYKTIHKSMVSWV